MSFKILHYSLGFPPKRTGGLTRYALDLAKEEGVLEAQIFFLFHGEMNVFSSQPSIQKSKKNSQPNFEVYKIKKSLPIPLFGGIKTPEDFMQPAPKQMYQEFLKHISPDIIHIHTLMGIHREFFEAAQELKIKITFTTHDYFGLFSEPSFFFNGKDYSEETTIKPWGLIEKTALPTYKLRAFQLRSYAHLRRIGTKLRKIKKINLNDTKDNSPIKQNKLQAFQTLKSYYFDIFNHIDYFLFNSSQTQQIYERHLQKTIVGRVIPVTNSSITPTYDKQKSYKKKKRIGYIGPNKQYKGFDEFLRLTKTVNPKDFEFHTFGYTAKINYQNIVEHGKYNTKDLQNIYETIDLLIVPSKWKETFGLIVLEALSFRTPILVSNNVGAKDILPEEYIFHSFEEMVEKVKHFDYNYFPYSTKNLQKYTMRNHAQKIMGEYEKLLNRANK